MDKEQTINALIKHYAEKWQQLGIDYVESHDYVNSDVARVSQLESVLEQKLQIMLEAISDSVFKKQLKTLRPSKRYKFQPDIDDVDTLFEELRYNIDCVNKSKVPNWLSTTIYFFNKNWRKQVYEKIAEIYCKIIGFAQATATQKLRAGRDELQAAYWDRRNIVLQDWDMLKRAIALVVKEKNQKLI